MKPPTRIPLRLASRVLVPSKTTTTIPIRPIHTTLTKAAHVAPIVGTGPPPEAPPAPQAETTPGYQRVERRRRQAELLKNAKEIRTGKDGKQTVLKKRFWTDVSVREIDGELQSIRLALFWGCICKRIGFLTTYTVGTLQVYLDERPLRHPQTKDVIRIPLTKPNLATALAIEWDSLTSAQEATRQHLIPLTSLVCRALDVQADDHATSPSSTTPSIRSTIVTTVLRYLDTDSLLCWAPPAGPHDIISDAGESLRDVQKRIADDVVSFLTTNTWPGITIQPVLDGHSIVPQSQAEGVREVVQGWVSGLDPWEITGLERAVLAGKSLITAARLVSEWSEGAAGAAELGVGGGFGAEEAAKATSLEVDWQASQWGEVEDTYDVSYEDVRRQLASVVLLVSGSGRS